MLAVAVEPDGELVAALPGEAEAGLDGAADAEVEGQLDDVRARRGGDLGGAVGRAVGDDDDLEAGIERVQLGEQARQVPLLVVGGDDRDPADGGERRACRGAATSARPQSTCAFTFRSSRSSSRRARWR